MTPKKHANTTFVTVSIRFPIKLFADIDALRIENNRSFNQQVIFMLKQDVHFINATLGGNNENVQEMRRDETGE